jgi:hypothetical protein
MVLNKIIPLTNQFVVSILLTLLFLFAMIFFVSLVLFPTDRIGKAILLVLFGLVVTQFGLMVSEDLIDRELLTRSMWSEVTSESNLLTTILGIASIGAGGSILANLADQSSTDKEVKVIDKTVIDNTQKVDVLISKVNKLDRMLKLVIGGVILLILLTLFKL